MRKIPCPLDCPKRSPDCHPNCPEYMAAWRESVASYKAKKPTGVHTAGSRKILKVAVNKFGY